MKTLSATAILKTAREALRQEGRAVLKAADSLDSSFERAAKLILRCKGRVVVAGIGKSGLIGRKIASTLASTGTPAIFVHPVDCLHGDLGMVSHGDIILALSHSGETEELSRLVEQVKKDGRPVIAITGRAKSSLARLADIAITSTVETEACPYNITPTTSTTVTLALGDALAVTLMRLKNFSDRDFARLHPGGSLGKLLAVEVRSIMHTGKNNPVVRENATVKDALFVMTGTRLGAASVVNKAGKLTGFFTDGDLRRHLQNEGYEVLSRPVSSVMTKNPLCLSPETLASEAARIFSARNIDNAPVADKSGRPVGILDERDLLGIIPLDDKNE